MSRKEVGASFRADVQYLRAFAVLSVVVYHYWPKLLPGGFVGVDVFFAISGFLITEHLLREYLRAGRINVVKFWARRIRRLLPASLATIAVSTLLTLWLVPKNFTQQFLDELFASTFYFENWQLAANSVDYLAADNTPSPVQHFWSLGVEEQFYLIWPVVLVLCILIAALLRIKSKRLVMLIGVTVIVGFSLGASIAQTSAGLPSAYFETTTRAWQLALGALLALSLLTDLAKSPVVLTVGRVIGWAGLAYTVYSFGDATPFPGYTAALPVLSTLLVIAMRSPELDSHVSLGDDKPSASKRVLRPFKFVGDISYSIYLWHWPLLILVPFIRGAYLSDAARILLFAAAILMGYLSKRFVEDPLRNPRIKRGLTPLTFAAAVTSMAILAAVIVPAQSQIAALAQDSKNEGMRLYAIGTPCFGAAAWTASAFECKSNGLDRNFVTPAAQSLKNDLPVNFSKCQGGPYDIKVVECVFGEKDGVRVALVGDSHAYMWIDTLIELAKLHHWQIHTFARASCPFSHVLWPRKVALQTNSCETWNTNLDALLAKQQPYKLLFTSLRSLADTPPGSDPAATALTGFQKSWQPLIDRGTKIVAIHDIPRPSGRQASCALKHPTHLKLCVTDYAVAMRQTDWLYKTSETVPGTARIDMTEFFCRDKACPDVIGHTFAYRDDSHLSATYGRTLTPFFAQKLSRAELIH